VIFSFQRHLPLPQEPELWCDWEYYYTQSIGCVGILKDWFTRALAEALAQEAPTLTRADLARHAWSLDQCEKMAQDALDGEAVLAEQPEAMERLRTLLGVAATPSVDTGSPRNRPPLRRAQGRRRVGVRRPRRDAVGRGGTN
jgi:hypothetical protein